LSAWVERYPMNPRNQGKRAGASTRKNPQRKGASREREKVSHAGDSLEQFLCRCYYVTGRVYILERGPLHGVEGVALIPVYEVHVSL
jgi:hypothetical protein